MKNAIMILLAMTGIASTSLASPTIDMDCTVSRNDVKVAEESVRLKFKETNILAVVDGYTVSMGRFNGPHVTVKFESSEQVIVGLYDWESAIDTYIETKNGKISLGCNSLVRNYYK
jgi:hypothetical protein